MGELFKDYLNRHLGTSGVRTQRALADVTGIDYGQLNKIFTGKTKRPEVETLEKLATALKRPIVEMMLAAGYPAPRADPPAPPPVVVDRPFDPASIVAYIESKPDEEFQAGLARQKARRSVESYTRLCLRIYRAWTSNADLVIGALEEVEI